MESNSKLISTFNIVQDKSENLYVFDPMMLTSLIILICLSLYLIESKYQK